MASQGLVTIRVDGIVAMKIVAGSNGYNAPILEAAIRQFGRVPELDEAYDLAQKHQFGSQEDLVVLTKTEAVFRGDSDLSERYRQTFHDPKFNPRWESGIAENMVIIDF